MDNPEPLLNIVFTRTAKGAIACKAGSKELPRQLKSLLLVVDGQSPVAKFVPYLSNLWPLSEKFIELELAGYVQRNHAEINALSGSDAALSQSISSHLSNQFANQISETEKADPIIANVLREIENFLAVNGGVEALQIMTVLSNIKTIDQLKADLPAYFDLIESYDLDASSHALKLENLLLGK